MRLTDAGEVRQERTLRRPTERMTAGEASDAGREKEGVLLKREEAQKVKLDLSEAIQEALQKQAEERKKSSEKSGDALVDLGKVMEIARRIARGDKVPDRDEKKLMEYSAELYQMAKSAAMLSRLKKQKKHKSLYDDEEEGGTMEEKLRALMRGDTVEPAGSSPGGGSDTGGEDEAAEE